MAKAYKVGNRVAYTTHRGSKGSGKIIGILNTTRGDWFQILPTGEKDESKFVSVRVSGVGA